MTVRAEVIGVGTELLLGQIANTNAGTIASALARIGVDCLRHTAVGDNEERIAAALEEAIGRADAVILTGGLGPTQDDVTREAIARAARRPLRRDPALAEEIRERFRHLGRAMPDANLRQADVPEGAEAIPNPLGTAPGLRVPIGDRVIYALPGVPWEMEPMLERDVLPDLGRQAAPGIRIEWRTIHTVGLAESAVAEALQPVWERMPPATTLAFLAGGGSVRIRITAKASSDVEAAARLGAAEAEVRRGLGAAVVGTDGDTLEVVVVRMLAERGWGLGVAESLTGGLIGGRITAVEGSSACFRGGIIAYSPEAKARLLGVPAALLTDPGPVSGPVARAMADGARKRLGAEAAVAVTGVAGPTADGAPVGTVFVGVAVPEGTVVRGARFPGTRENVRALTATGALNLLRLVLLGEVEPEAAEG